MRQLPIAGLVLVLLGCGPRVPAPERFRQLHVRYVRGDPKGTIAECDRELARSDVDPQTYWDFFYEKAEALREVSGAQASAAWAATKSPPDTPEFAYARSRKLYTEGWNEYSFGDFAKARAAFAGAEALARRTGKQLWLARILDSESQVLVRQKEFALGGRMAAEGAEIATAAHDLPLTAYSLHLNGQMLMSQGRYAEALPVYERQEEILHKMNRPGDYPYYLDLALCRYSLGQLDAAMAAFEQVLAKARAVGDRQNMQAALNDMGGVYLRRQEFRKALEHYKMALDLARALKLNALVARDSTNVAEAAIELGLWDEARKYNDEGLAVKRRLHEISLPYSLVNAGFIASSTGNAAEAQKNFREVIEDWSTNPAMVLRAHTGLAEMYAAGHRDADAEREFRAALDVVEQGRQSLVLDQLKLDYLANLIRTHESFVDFLMAHNRQEQALEVAESSRARLLQEKLGGDHALPNPGAGAYRRAAAKSGAVLLSYWTGTKHSYVWAVTPHGITWAHLPRQAELRALVDRYRGMIEGQYDPLSADDPTGRTLYATLVGPVADRLGARVILSAGGPLSALNFETLPVPEGGYLLEKTAVSVTPSLNLLAEPAERMTRDGRMLLIGDPNFSSPQFPRLPFAGQEIDAIQRDMGARVTCLRGAAATPAAFRSEPLRNFEFIHFAAHASTNAQQPLESTIILAGPEPANRLMASDVVSARTNAELVTLSSCRTAGAKSYSGEGLVGFMWAFFRAGAHSVIAGLWDVSDESTPALMADLYARLARREDPETALRAAKMALVAQGKYRLPYYWGAFQLYVRDLRAAGPR